MKYDVKESEKKEPHKQGKPWDNAGRYMTYVEASAAKEQLEEAVAQGDVLGKQYKIRHMRDLECFIVKSRTDPEFEEQEKALQKKKRANKSGTKKSGKSRRSEKGDKKNDKKR